MASAAVAIRTSPALYTIPRGIRVVTVDGQQIVQEGVSAMINREPDMAVVAVASSAAEALEAIARHQPDVVTLDLLLPDMPCRILARRIRAESRRTRIVGITGASGHLCTQLALDAGVHGYLSKAAPASELVCVIRRVLARERIVPGPVVCDQQNGSERDPQLVRDLYGHNSWRSSKASRPPADDRNFLRGAQSGPISIVRLDHVGKRRGAAEF